MHILLGSGGFRTPERIHLLTATMRSYFGSIRKLLFIPYALQDYDKYVMTVLQRGLDAGYEIDGIHNHADPLRAIWEAEGIFVGGGNTFRLLKTLYDLQLMDLLRSKVKGGLPYLGVSAGCNLACPTIRTTNDMPIVEPPTLNALNLVPFQVNPHYVPGTMYYQDVAGNFVPYYGETREDRLREFHEENYTPVIGLWEGGILEFKSGTLKVLGTPARLMKRGQTAVDYPAGSQIPL